MADKLEDAIYASPVGSTTPWRCVECNTAIPHEEAPCKCFPFLAGRALPNLPECAWCALGDDCPRHPGD